MALLSKKRLQCTSKAINPVAGSDRERNQFSMKFFSEKMFGVFCQFDFERNLICLHESSFASSIFLGKSFHDIELTFSLFEYIVANKTTAKWCYYKVKACLPG